MSWPKKPNRGRGKEMVSVLLRFRALYVMSAKVGCKLVLDKSLPLF
jgi:hypothetical protein